MRATLVFLFGRRWWVPWHVHLYLWLFAIWGFYAYFQDFVPGAGPQGGEAIVALMMLMFLILGGASLINGLLWLSTRTWRRVPRYLLGVPALMVLAGGLQILIFGLVVETGNKEESATWRAVATILMLAAVALYYALNLYALDRFRRS